MARPVQDAAGTEEPDERLLIEAAQRDPNRFADLYERNFERVYAYIARRVHDRGDAQDLTSEVFHQALANLQGFEWRGAPFAAWLFRIAANAITDHWGRLARETSVPGTSVPVMDESHAAAAADVEPSARLFRWVNRLPEDQRRVITMRFVEEKSIREIAGVLGRTEGAVKQLQLRALQNLRARMGKARG